MPAVVGKMPRNSGKVRCLAPADIAANYDNMVVLLQVLIISGLLRATGFSPDKVQALYLAVQLFGQLLQVRAFGSGC